MGRTSHNTAAWLALAAIIGAGFAPAFDLDPPGQSRINAIPPPVLCDLLPFLDDTVIRLPRFAESDALVTSEGYRLPLASRAPPEQA